MVKSDASRDYYGDLGLPFGADPSEVRSQFRKLALKYHPDRNPGHEAEFNAKFQAIQSAHEVLTDPQLRSKYDEQRLKPTAPGVPFAATTRPNMPTAASNFPPPPRRNPVPTATGRYATPRNPPGYPPYTSGSDDNAKANYKAWESMRPGAGTTPKSYRTGSGPRPGAFSPNDEALPPRTAPPKTPKTEGPANKWKVPPASARPPFTPNAWDKWTSAQQANPQGKPSQAHPVPPLFTRANTTRLPKKNGFAPNPPPRDEPPRSAYSHVSQTRPRPPTARYQTEYDPRPQPGAPFPGSRGSRPPTPETQRPYQSSSDDPFGERLSTPYSTAGGEKTYFSSHGMGRSASVRSNAGKAQATYAKSPLSPETDGRRRSASPRMRSPNPRRASYSSSSDSSEDDFNKATHNQRRKSADHRFETRPTSVRAPGTSGSNTRAPRVDDLSSSESEWERSSRPRLNKQYSSSQPSSRKGSTHPDHVDGFSQHRDRLDPEHARYPPPPNTSSTHHAHSPLHTNPPWQAPPSVPEPVEKSKSWYENFGPKHHGNTQREFERPTTTDAKHQPRVDRDSAHTDHGTSQPPRPSSSTENIDTNFSATAWQGKFTGSAEDYLAPNSGYNSSGRASPPKPRKSPTRNRTKQALPQRSSSDKDAAYSAMPPPPTPNSTVKPAPPPGPARFSPEKWQQTFKEPSWAYQAPPPPSQSPGFGSARRMKSARKLSTNKRKPTISKSANIPNVQAEVDDTGADETSSAPESEHTSSGNGSAMDLDPATPPSELQTHKSPDSKSKIASPNGVEEATPVASRQQQIEVDPQTPLNKLGDLKNVTPLSATNATGLDDLHDISTTLPFPSRAAQPIPAKPVQPQRLDLPHPPKAPQFSQPVTKESWERDLPFLTLYQYEWNEYNAKMLAHFDGRQKAVCDGKALGDNWIARFDGVPGMDPSVSEDGKKLAGKTVGEAEGGLGGILRQDSSTEAAGGFEKYCAWLEEDARVREHWDVSWEKHRAFITEVRRARQMVAECCYSRVAESSC